MTFLLANGAYEQYARGAKLSHNEAKEKKKTTANKLPAISRQSLLNSFIIKLLKRSLIVQEKDQRVRETEKGRGRLRGKEKERKAVRYVSTIVALSSLCQST